MQKITLVCAVGLFVLAGCTQKSKENQVEVPTIVKESFSKLFTNASDVKWSKESDSEYEVEFRLGSSTKSSNFDQFGKWLITETVIKSTDLPAPVLATITNEFASYSIAEAEVAEPASGSLFYEVELESGEVNIEVQISPDGKLLKKEEMKEKEDGEEEDEKD